MSVQEPLRLAEGEYRFACLFLSAKPISEAEAAEIRALLDAAHDKEG